MNTITISATTARRLAVARQHLSGPTPVADSNTIMDVVRELGCLQLDPTSAVARSHLLVLWSRFGSYDTALLDQLLWDERKLFEYWAHAASIVLTEDYPIHQFRMKRYPPEKDTAWSQRVRQWIADNERLRRHILSRLRRNGPLLARELRSDGVDASNWISSGWTSERNVARMLDFLWAQGKIMVAGRIGGQKAWDLSERCLPEWTPRDKLSARDVTWRATLRSLRALGVATRKQIADHFTRGRYPEFAGVFSELIQTNQAVPVQIRDDGSTWTGEWFIHQADVPLLEQLARGEWQPRTTLLSPFDNLICDRARTEQLWNFRFRLEIYTPKHKREHGYYVLPILHGERLIGRVDPKMDRKRGKLTIHAVHAEPDAPRSQQTARAIRDAVDDLATFLGAREIEFTSRVPDAWARALRGNVASF